MKRIDDHEVLIEVERHINSVPRLLTEQELDEAIILAAGKRYLHQRHRALKALFQEQLQATLKEEQLNKENSNDQPNRIQERPKAQRSPDTRYKSMT